jgi:hypothetical protein
MEIQAQLSFEKLLNNNIRQNKTHKFLICRPFIFVYCYITVLLCYSEEYKNYILLKFENGVVSFKEAFSYFIYLKI